MEIPKTMKAVVRKDEEGKDISLEEIPVPVPKKDEVLVKVMATPCNPSDYYWAKGQYGAPGTKPAPPIVPGLEGSGIVVGVGEGVSKDLIGKKVGIFCETYEFKSYFGNWAQYTIKRLLDIYVLKNQAMSFEDTCSLFVNPMSVMLMWHIIEQDKHTGVIHTAASSSLAKCLFRLCKKKGMPIINIVRSAEHVKDYETMGAVYTLNQNDPDFKAKLAAVIAKVKPSVCFDAVVGDLGGLIFKELLPYSHYYIYGGLSGKPLPEVRVVDTLFAKKQVRGFWLSEQLPKISRDRVLEDLDFITADISSPNSCFKQAIVKEYKLEDFKTVMTEYAAVAAKGKLIMKPNN